MIAPLKAAKRREMTVELAVSIYHDVASVVVALLTMSVKKLFYFICVVRVVPNNLLGVQMGKMERMAVSSKNEYLMRLYLTAFYSR